MLERKLLKRSVVGISPTWPGTSEVVSKQVALISCCLGMKLPGMLLHGSSVRTTHMQESVSLIKFFNICPISAFLLQYVYEELFGSKAADL